MKRNTYLTFTFNKIKAYFRCFRLGFEKKQQQLKNMLIIQEITRETMNSNYKKIIFQFNR